MIKALIILVSVLLAFEALWAGLWAYINFYRFGTWEYKIEDFKEYRADFEAIKDEWQKSFRDITVNVSKCQRKLIELF